MALKFLNKKGWHTGSLRNIENVWKAEQKHEAEQRKLEEIRKQIQEEKERFEIRLLQEQAGLVPRQERLEFLYESGLAVGKSIDSGGASSSGGTGVAFKAPEETLPSNSQANGQSSGAASKDSSSAPGALFEDKPHSANDSWRKLHSDPLLLIRQREQEAIARIRNNPVQMAPILKSIEESKKNNKSRAGKKHKKKKKEKHLSSKRRHDSEDSDEDRSKYDSESGREWRTKRMHRGSIDRGGDSPSRRREANHTRSDVRKPSSREDYEHWANGRRIPGSGSFGRDPRRYFERSQDSSQRDERDNHRRRTAAPKLSEEDRAAKLQEMQMDAELHEEQRWKRLKKADENEVKEALDEKNLKGRNFLDAAHKSVYGAEKGGSTTIEESVRRRTHYSQRSSGEGHSHAFRR